MEWCGAHPEREADEDRSAGAGEKASGERAFPDEENARPSPVSHEAAGRPRCVPVSVLMPLLYHICTRRGRGAMGARAAAGHGSHKGHVAGTKLARRTLVSASCTCALCALDAPCVARDGGRSNRLPAFSNDRPSCAATLGACGAGMRFAVQLAFRRQVCYNSARNAYENRHQRSLPPTPRHRHRTVQPPPAGGAGRPGGRAHLSVSSWTRAVSVPPVWASA